MQVQTCPAIHVWHCKKYVVALAQASHCGPWNGYLAVVASVSSHNVVHASPDMCLVRLDITDWLL